MVNGDLTPTPRWKCGRRARRHGTYPHEFIDIGLDATVLVVATVGVYECQCGERFAYELREVPTKGNVRTER